MWRLPVPATAVTVAAVSVFTIALLGTWSMLSWPFQEWVRTSAAFHQQTAISLPVVGAAAAIVAVWGSRSSGTESPARPLLVLHVGVVIAHLAGLLPLVVATAMTARAGGPDLAAMLTGPLGLTAATACGHLIGLCWRSLLAVPTTAVLLTAATFFGTSTDAAAAVVPVQYMTAALGQQPSGAIVMYRLAFLVIVTVAASWLTARRWARPGANAAGSLLTAGAIVAVAVVVPVSTTPALFVLDSEPPRTCTARAGVDYCVHSGHHEVLDELVDGMSRLATRYGPLTVRLDRTYDVALAGATDLGEDRDRERTLWFDIRPEATPDGELPVIADLLAGVGACGHGSPDATAYARQLGRWLVAEDTATNAFHGVPLGVMHDWIVRNQPAINACAIDSGLLPRP